MNLSKLTSSSEHGIIMLTGGDGVRVIGKIDIEMLRGISSNILENEVVLMDERKEHIKAQRGNDFLSMYMPFFVDILNDPDVIFKDSKNLHTALVCKRMVAVTGKVVCIVLKLAVKGDNPNYKNSIITAHELNDRQFAKYLRNKKIVYQKG